jgi:hypothetical protein
MHECLASRVITQRFSTEYNNLQKTVENLTKWMTEQRAKPEEPEEEDEVPDDTYSTFQRLQNTSTIIYNNANRTYRPILENYYVEVGKFMGIKLGGQSGASFVQEHLGVFLRDDFRVVALPSSIIDELTRDVVFREHTWEVFLTLVTRCRQLCSVMDIPHDVERDTVLYAPVIAFMRFWLEQQQMSSLLLGKAVHIKRVALPALAFAAASTALLHMIVVPVLAVGALIWVAQLEQRVLPSYENEIPYITTGDPVSRCPAPSRFSRVRSWATAVYDRVSNVFQPRFIKAVDDLSSWDNRNPFVPVWDVLPDECGFAGGSTVGELNRGECEADMADLMARAAQVRADKAVFGQCVESSLPRRSGSPSTSIANTHAIATAAVAAVVSEVVDSASTVAEAPSPLPEPSAPVSVEDEVVTEMMAMEATAPKVRTAASRVKPLPLARVFKVYFGTQRFTVSAPPTLTFDELAQQLQSACPGSNIFTVGGVFMHKNALLSSLDVDQAGLRLICVDAGEVDLRACGYAFGDQAGYDLVARAAPPVDLTEQGVEPNPGPVVRSALSGGHDWWGGDKQPYTCKFDLPPLCVSADFGSAYPPKTSNADIPEQSDNSYVCDKMYDRRHGPNRKQYSQHKFGLGSGVFKPVYYDASSDNEMTTIKARVTAKKPGFDAEYRRRFTKWFKCNWKTFFPNIYRVHKMDELDYIEKSNASPSVKAQLKDAWRRLKEAGMSHESSLPPELLKLWTKTKAFIKVENGLYSGLLGEKEKAPRNISSCIEEFTILVAPTIIGFQQQVKECWRPPFPLVFSSGVPAHVVATELANAPGHIVEDDVDFWDMCVSGWLLELEVWLMRKLHAGKAVTDLMRAAIPTRGKTQTGIQYSDDPTRKSGVSYTSLFNTIWNVLLHLFAVTNERRLPVLIVMATVIIFGCGDDNIMRFTGPMVNFKEYMAKFGFIAKAIYRIALQFAEYCSNRFYPVSNGTWTMAPKLGRVIAKLGYFINPPKNVNPLAMVRGSALGLWNACYCVRPLRSYLSRLLQLTEGYAPYYGKLEEWKMVYTAFEPGPATDSALQDVYDWDSGRQKMFESTLSGLKLGDELVSPLAQLAMDRDTQSASWCYDKNTQWGSFAAEGCISPASWTQDWENRKDLTAEGVEPNPGPPKADKKRGRSKSAERKRVTIKEDKSRSRSRSKSRSVSRGRRPKSAMKKGIENKNGGRQEMRKSPFTNTGHLKVGRPKHELRDGRSHDRGTVSEWIEVMDWSQGTTRTPSRNTGRSSAAPRQGADLHQTPRL